MHEIGCSGLEHWEDPEGWDGEGGGRGVQDWDTHDHFLFPLISLPKLLSWPFVPVLGPFWSGAGDDTCPQMVHEDKRAMEQGPRIWPLSHWGPGSGVSRGTACTVEDRNGLRTVPWAQGCPKTLGLRGTHPHPRSWAKSHNQSPG